MLFLTSDESFDKGGLVMPNRILFVAKPGRPSDGGLLQADSFSKMQGFLDGVIRDLPGTNIDDFEGVLVMSGNIVSSEQISSALDPAAPSDPALTALRYYMLTQVTPDRKALYITMVAEKNPYTEEGM